MISRRTLHWFLLLPGLLVLSAPTTLAGPEDGRLAVLTYRLAEGSRYVQGCVPPCPCALIVENDLRGTLRLVPEAADRHEVRYRIDDLLWVVSAPAGGELRITGSGGLRRSDGQVRAYLDLGFDGGNPVRYEAVASASGFPDLALTFRIPEASCSTNGFRIVARPVPGNASVPYRLGPGSRYAYGCLNGLCDCPVSAQALVGGFRALPLGRHDGALEFALVGFDAFVPSPAGTPGKPVHGVALYRLGDSGQEMFGVFAIGEQLPAIFESGLVDGAAPPALDITVIDDWDTCVSQALRLQAAPDR